MRGGAWVLVAAMGCGPDEPKPVDTGPTAAVDADADGATAAADCDDQDGHRFPGAPDPWYDGIDQDCAGNDDYDQDGDGHGSAAYGGDDCDDHDAGVSPTAAETAYDGLDNDCDPATPDDDLDGDGYGAAEDCEDANVAVHPGALEVLDDLDDDDCDGEVDRAEWGTAGLSFLDPGRPALGQTDDYVVLAFRATDALDPAWPELSDFVSPGLLVTLAPDHVGGADPATGAVAFWGEADVDSIVVADLETSGGTALVGTSYLSSVNDYGYLGLRPLTWLGPGVGWFQDPPSYYRRNHQDWPLSDLRVDADGERWLCGGGAASVDVAMSDGTADSPGIGVDGVDASLGCFWTADAVFTTVDAKGAATSWAVDPTFATAPVPTVSQPLSDRAWRGGHERGGVTVALAQSDGVRTFEDGVATEWLAGDVVLDAELAHGSDGSRWLAAVIEQAKGAALVLVSEDAGGTRVERSLDARFDGRTLRPLGTSVWVTDDRVFVALSALDQDGTGRDMVGWVAYGR